MGEEMSGASANVAQAYLDDAFRAFRGYRHLGEGARRAGDVEWPL